jgi:hypothetical protein
VVTTNREGFDLSSLVTEPVGDTGNSVIVALFASPKLPDHVVELRLVFDGAALVPFTVVVRPSSALAAISTAALRRVPIATLVNLVHSKIASSPSIDSVGAEDVKTSRSLVRRLADQARPGRRVRDDAFYVGIASEYLFALANPPTAHKPLAATAERLHFAPGTVSNLLAEAQRRELIEGRSKGRPGLRITTKGVHALEVAVTEKLMRSKKGPAGPTEGQGSQDGID